MRPAFAGRMKEYNEVKKDVELTVIVPIYNCEDLILETLNNIQQLKNISYDVLLMDDGSTDSTVEICERFCAEHPNFYLFSQKNRGAGRARNGLIPLISGTYSYFLDSDDFFDSKALEGAVKYAEKKQHDLLFVKYKISFHEQHKTRGMFDADEKAWANISKGKDQQERAKAAAALINYPWNRIIKTSLLHDENIFFGPTIVHNDIPYHWHSIVASKNLGVFNEPVCTHRKFDARWQITNINDSRRMMVFEALRHTFSAVNSYETFHNIRDEWVKFSHDLLIWAETRIPDELNESFKVKKDLFIKSLEKG
jgi:glycosyltransferase involved in cell wall biosynthesis